MGAVSEFMNSERQALLCTSRTLAEYSCRGMTSAGPPASRALGKVSFAALRLNISGYATSYSLRLL